MKYNTTRAAVTLIIFMIIILAITVFLMTRLDNLELGLLALWGLLIFLGTKISCMGEKK